MPDICVAVVLPQYSSVCVSRMNNRRGQWVCSMLTGRNNDLNVKNSHTLALFGVQVVVPSTIEDGMLALGGLVPKGAL